MLKLKNKCKIGMANKAEINENIHQTPPSP